MQHPRHLQTAEQIEGAVVGDTGATEDVLHGLHEIPTDPDLRAAILPGQLQLGVSGAPLIEALIRRANGRTSETARVLQAGDVTLDREERTVRQNGKLIELTAKEFQLLELLMLSPRKVLSRTRILNKVWNYDADPLTNIVDVYVRRLRTKLAWDPDHGLIRTLRGYGYKLDVSP
jgi:DNA-binding winged helix-turn-helix (wHTH) protein